MNQRPEATLTPRLRGSYKDHGYAWVIVFVCFMIHLIVDGTFFTFGVIYVEMIQQFNSRASDTAWIGSLQSSLTLILGFASGAMVDIYGCRPVMILGSIIASAGFALSVLAPSVFWLYLSSGLMPGIGFSMLYIPSVVAVQQYFEKRRSLATGISFCGTGAGVILFAPFIRWLLTIMGWKEAMLVQAGIILSVAALSVLVRPPPPEDLQSTPSSESGSETTKPPTKLWDSINRAFNQIFDLSLLKNPIMALSVISGFFWSCGHLPPFVFIPSRAGEKGIDEWNGAFLVSIMGLGNTASRLIFGWIADNPKINRLLLFSMAVLGAATASLLSPLGYLFWHLALYSAAFGLFLGCYMATLPVALVDMLGVDNIAKSFGLVMSSAGLAALVVIPFGGWLYDTFGSYAYPFWVTGALQALGGFISLFILVSPWRGNIYHLDDDVIQKTELPADSVFYHKRGSNVYAKQTNGDLIVPHYDKSNGDLIIAPHYNNSTQDLTTPQYENKAKDLVAPQHENQANESLSAPQHENQANESLSAPQHENQANESLSAPQHENQANESLSAPQHENQTNEDLNKVQKDLVIHQYETKGDDDLISPQYENESCKHQVASRSESSVKKDATTSHYTNEAFSA